MRRDEVFVQAVEEAKMEKAHQGGAEMLRRSRSSGSGPQLSIGLQLWL
jgi:hypothetical protein